MMRATSIAVVLLVGITQGGLEYLSIITKMNLLQVFDFSRGLCMSIATNHSWSAGRNNLQQASIRRVLAKFLTRSAFFYISEDVICQKWDVISFFIVWYLHLALEWPDIVKSCSFFITAFDRDASTKVCTAPSSRACRDKMPFLSNTNGLSGALVFSGRRRQQALFCWPAINTWFVSTFFFSVMCSSCRSWQSPTAFACRYSSKSELSVSLVENRDSAPAVLCFCYSRCWTSQSSSRRRSRHCANRLFDSFRARIYCNDWWSVLTVSGHYSTYKCSINTDPTTAGPSFSVVSILFLASFTVRLQYPNTQISPSSCSCKGKHTICLLHASVSIANFLLGLDRPRTGGVVSFSFKSSSFRRSLSSN